AWSAALGKWDKPGIRNWQPMYQEGYEATALNYESARTAIQRLQRIVGDNQGDPQLAQSMDTLASATLNQIEVEQIAGTGLDEGLRQAVRGRGINKASMRARQPMLEEEAAKINQYINDAFQQIENWNGPEIAGITKTALEEASSAFGQRLAEHADMALGRPPT